MLERDNVDTSVKPAGARSKASQEAGWSKIYDRMKRFCENNPEDHLATLLMQMRGLDLGRWTFHSNFYRDRPLLKNFAKNIMELHETSLDDPFLYPNIGNRKYIVSGISPIRYIMRQITTDTEAVIELGSGWSHNLMQIYVGIGRTRSKTIDYIGAEYTESGRRCAKLAAGFDGAINFHGYEFDYRNPDVSFLKNYRKHVIVFTHHSIEQVEIINRKLFEDIIESNLRVTLIHVEPVGWQRDNRLIKARKEGNNKLFQYFSERFEKAIISEQDQVENAAWWSWRLSYNINLLDLISEYTASKKLMEIYRTYDFDRTTNILNPPSLIHLETA